MSTENMTDIDLALDDLITKHKPSFRRGSFGGAGGGGGKRFAPRVDDALTPVRRSGGGGRRGGSWGFGSGGGGRFGGGGGFGRRRMDNSFGGGGRNDEDVVWINISDIPESVTTQDLQELFQDFNLFGVGVHYNEFGQHMGTADLYVDTRSAKSILREYSTIAIDGQKIRFAVVNDKATETPLFLNNQRSGGGGPIRSRRRRSFANAGRSNSARSSRTYSRSRSPAKRGGGGGSALGVGGTARAARRGPNAPQQARERKPKSTDELDHELELYMKGNKHPRIKLNPNEAE